MTTVNRKEATWSRTCHRCSDKLQDLRRKGLRHVIEEEEEEAPSDPVPDSTAETSPSAPTRQRNPFIRRRTGKSEEQSQSGSFGREHAARTRACPSQIGG